MIAFSVYGTPAPQGSKRHVGNGRMIESSKKVKPWRAAVKAEAEIAIRRKSLDVFGGTEFAGCVPPVEFPLQGPLVVTLLFSLPKPKTEPKKRRTLPIRKPDLDKLIRSTLDAITDAKLWGDDSQVVRIVADKDFPGMSGALPEPGCKVSIFRADLV